MTVCICICTYCALTKGYKEIQATFFCAFPFFPSPETTT